MNEIKKTIISAVAVFLALVLTFTWAYTGWRKAKKLDTAVTPKRPQLTGLNEKIGSIPQLRQEKGKLQDELTEYETILPNGRELENLLDMLTEFTKDSGVTILEFKPERERQDKPGESSSSYKQVSYDLKVDGDFYQVTKFINLLENYKRFVRIDSFEMGKRDLDEPIGETALRISTFVYDPKSEPAAKKRAATRTAARKNAKESSAPESIPFVLVEERAKQFIVQVNAESATTVRDPFTNPLTRLQTDVPNPRLAERGRKLSPAEEQEVIQTVQQKLGLVSDLIRSGDFEKASEAFLEVESKLACEFRDPALQTQVAAIRTRTEEIGELLKTGRGKKLFEMIGTQYDAMQQAFSVADYQGVAKVHEDIAEMLKKTEGINYEGLAELVKNVNDLANRATVCEEFAGFNIDVQGVIWMRDGRAAAIVNGQSVIEGDKVRMGAVGVKPGTRTVASGDNDIFVHAIARDKITFRYKGERIDKVLIE